MDVRLKRGRAWKTVSFIKYEFVIWCKVTILNKCLLSNIQDKVFLIEDKWPTIIALLPINYENECAIYFKVNYKKITSSKTSSDVFGLWPCSLHDHGMSWWLPSRTTGVWCPIYTVHLVSFNNIRHSSLMLYCNTMYLCTMC